MEIAAALERIALGLERLAPPEPKLGSLDEASAFLWEAGIGLRPIVQVQHVPLSALLSIDLQKRLLLENSLQFAAGFGANNALLWGARGMGKSSLVKAVHHEINQRGVALKLIEIHRDELRTLPVLLRHLRALPHRCLVLCDDLSFETQDADYKALKSVLDGGIEGRGANVLFYATSNRRHLMPREMIENEQQRAITPGEVIEEKISLSDRFGLWIGFHGCDQAQYLAMVAHYAALRGLAIGEEALRAQAIEWQATRGSRSGRVAYQFVDGLSGKLALQGG